MSDHRRSRLVPTFGEPPRHLGSWIWLAIGLAVCVTSGSAHGQPIAVAAAAPTSDESEGKHPFVVPLAKTETLETLDDFRRAVRKEGWEQAFKLLDKLSADSAAGLVSAQDGLKIPLARAVAADLAALPPAGKNAFRLFHDAGAKKLWEQAQQARGSEEFEKLSRLATWELMTSVGDQAADRLGDLLFEDGDLGGAIECWRRVIDQRPDSGLSRAQLLTKIGVALSQSGGWTELAEVHRLLAERHAGEQVQVGGREVEGAPFLAGLLANAATGGGRSGQDFPDDLRLPEGNEPLWQFRFERGEAVKTPRVRRWNRWGGDDSQLLNELVMPAEVSGNLLCANWLGCDFAIDLATGKLRWRNGRFHDLVERMQQGNGMAADQFALRTDNGRVWLISHDVQRLDPTHPQFGMQSERLQLVERDLQSGQTGFSSSQFEALQPYVAVSAPLPAGDVVYLAAYKENQPTELLALAIKPASGHLQWTTPLGTYQFSQQQFLSHSTRPTLTLSGARLFVDTHAGGLLSLEAATGKLLWAYAYPSQSPENQRNWYNNNATASFCPSQAIAHDGLVWNKGMSSPRLSAVRQDGSALVWKRSVPSSAFLAGLDDERVYLAGEEVLALDAKTHELVWSNRLPAGTTWVRPYLTRNRYYQFTPRGVYELDKRTGDSLRLFRGADLESSGGAVLATDRLLITVSAHAVTAYAMPAARTSADASAARTTPNQEAAASGEKN